VEVPAENPDDPATIETEITSRWDSTEYDIPQPGGKIISLAVTPTRLYALCFDDHNANATLRYIKSGGEWESITPISGYPIQSIYTDPEDEKLFVGARVYNGGSFAIFYLDNDDKLQPFKKDTDILPTALLSGAVYREGYFYLSTRGEIYRVKDDLTETILLGEKIVVMGMIKLENKDAENGPTIIAVARGGGILYEVNPDSIEMMTYTSDVNYGKTIATGNYATGALALWEDPGREIKKLIVGVQGRLSTVSSSSSYSHGYAEFYLKYNDGSFDASRHDIHILDSVDNVNRYTASLGKHPINHLFQTPPEIDPNRTFFASTQTTGLWSYRDRDNEGWRGWQWNAEE
jgi:hypothetical protein